jgi:hypothetical protein
MKASFFLNLLKKADLLIPDMTYFERTKFHPLLKGQCHEMDRDEPMEQ